MSTITYKLLLYMLITFRTLAIGGILKGFELLSSDPLPKSIHEGLKCNQLDELLFSQSLAVT